MEAIYFAGGIFPAGEYVDKKHPVEEFALVHCPPDDRPYLTHKPNGLKLTGHHADLYVLHPNGKSARLVDHRTERQAGAPYEVELSETQQEAIRKAIETGYFFD